MPAIGPRPAQVTETNRGGPAPAVAATWPEHVVSTPVFQVSASFRTLSQNRSGHAPVALAIRRGSAATANTPRYPVNVVGPPPASEPAAPGPRGTHEKLADRGLAIRLLAFGATILTAKIRHRKGLHYRSRLRTQARHQNRDNNPDRQETPSLEVGAPTGSLGSCSLG